MTFKGLDFDEDKTVMNSQLRTAMVQLTDDISEFGPVSQGI